MGPFICLFGAFLLTILTKMPVAYAMNQKGGYDNKHPRDQQAQLTGWGKRALAAHQNMYESFAPFAVAILAAVVGKASMDTMTFLGTLYLIARVFYTILYIVNIHWARSLVWGVGFACTGALMLLPLL